MQIVFKRLLGWRYHHRHKKNVCCWTKNNYAVLLFSRRPNCTFIIRLLTWAQMLFHTNMNAKRMLLQNSIVITVVSFANGYSVYFLLMLAPIGRLNKINFLSRPKVYFPGALEQFLFKLVSQKAWGRNQSESRSSLRSVFRKSSTPWSPVVP